MNSSNECNLPLIVSIFCYNYQTEENTKYLLVSNAKY